MLKMKNKILLLIVFSILLISINFISAENIGTFKKGNNVVLPQVCATCTYNNITTILAPDGTTLVSNVAMGKDGSYFNYTLDSSYTTQIGTYKVNGIGDLDGTNTGWTYDFDITPSGFINTNSFIFIFLAIIALVFLLGVKLENNWIMMFGSLLILLFGFWIIIYGIDLIKDTTTTWAVGLIIWGIGIYAMYLSVEGQLAEGGWK